MRALWTFHLIAQPGDPNNKTWENDAWKTAGGTNTWGYLSVDEERGIVYIPVSIAGGDYVGVERPGDNLYGTSLVAVDIATGKRSWHQQLVHHDIWDFDLAAAPTLFDAVKDGKRIPAVAQITKMGMLFIFNRMTGEPMFGIEERPVPQTTRAGREDVADATVPDQASATGAHIAQEERAADDDLAGAHRVLRGAVGQVQARRHGSVHAVEAQTGHRHLSGRYRRGQLERRHRTTSRSV